jgi:hypothetical protein
LDIKSIAEIMVNIQSVFFTITITMSILLTTHVGAQTFQNIPLKKWVTYQGSQYLFNHSASATDALNNVCVAGATISGTGDYNIYVVKYDSNGIELWADEENGLISGDDFATDIVIDSNGDVIVTGAVENSTSGDYDLWVRKYSSGGSILWTDIYDGQAGSYDAGTCLTIDPSNNIYVGGGTFTVAGTIDFFTRKYTSTGAMQWTSTWDQMGFYDGVVKIRYSSTGISVAGGSQVSADTWRYAVLRYNSNTGVLASTYVSAGGTATIDQIKDLVIDDQNNSYILGGVEEVGEGYNIKLVKLNTNLSVLWEKTINGNDNLDDMGEAIAIDVSGDVYITGYTTSISTVQDVVTNKYNSAGVLQWSQTYNGSDSGLDKGKAIEINSNGDVYVGATSFIGTTNDLLTLKYNSAGVLKWKTDFNGLANKNEEAINLALDEDENIILTGSSEHVATTRYVTVHYNETNVVTPPDEESYSLFKTFRENSGQIQKSNGSAASEVLFSCPSSSPATFVLKDRISFVMASLDTAETDSIHRVDILFNKSNSDQKFMAVDRTEFYENYYNSTIHNFTREKVRTYGALYSPEVSNNIDVRLSHNENGSKIYLICKPGFSTANLKFETQGHDGLAVIGSDLIISTSLGSFKFVQGEAYEIDNSGTRVDLAWQPTFSVAGNEVSLGVGSFSGSNTLVLELDQGNSTNGGGGANGNLNWSTYLGNSESEAGIEFDIDGFGNLFCAGTVQILTFPEFEGQIAELVENLGGFDSFVVKLLPNGQPSWGAYYGTEFSDFGDEVVADDFGNAYLAGNYTAIFGTNELPLIDAFQTTSGGGSGTDAFILKLDFFGFPVWASYFGGNSTDIIHDLQIIPGTQRLVIVGGSQSSMGIPLEDSQGYFRDVTLNGTGGILDGFIAEISAEGNLNWSTYFGSYSNGGYTEIGGASIDITDPNRLVITGNVQGIASSVLTSPQDDFVAGFPLVDPGNNAYIDDNIEGAFDAFISEFDLTTHELIWSTVFGGNGSESELGHGEIGTLSIEGRYYDAITGTISSSSGFDFESPGQQAFQQTSPVIDDVDIFIAVFYDRSLEWSSLLGSGYYEIPQGIAYNDNRDLFLVGKTKSELVSDPLYYCDVPGTDEFVLCNAGGGQYFDIVPSTTDNQKGFITAFNSGYQLGWSTLFGGTDVDGIEGLEIDRENDFLYICGFTKSPQDASFPLQQWLSTSYFDEIHDGSQDAFMARFAIDDILVSVDENMSNTAETLSIFATPNPTNGHLQIIGLPVAFRGVIELFNSEGRLVWSDSPLSSLNSPLTIDLGGLTPGVYVLRVLGDSIQESLRIVILK